MGEAGTREFRGVSEAGADAAEGDGDADGVGEDGRGS